MSKQSNRRRGNGEGSIYFREDKGLWCVSITVGFDETGKQKRKVIYSKDHDEVLKKKQEIENSINTGNFIEPTKMTVSEYINQWMQIYKNSVRLSTYVRNNSVIKKHVFSSIGYIQLSKLTPIQLQFLYNTKIQEGQSPRSVRNLHFVLHKAFAQAVKWGYLSKNVADLIDLPKPQKEEIKVLSKEESELFLNAAKNDWYYPLYVTALTTGMRQGELVGLKWSDIDLENGTIAVQRTIKELNGKLLIGEPKSKNARRTVTLPQNTIRVLKEHKKNQFENGYTGTGYVFTDTKGNLIRVQNMVRRSFKEILKKAGLPDIRFHDLRHTHATLLLQQGVNPKLVQERLGHSSISLTLDTYSHVLPNMQKQVAEELDRIFKV